MHVKLSIEMMQWYHTVSDTASPAHSTSRVCDIAQAITDMHLVSSYHEHAVSQTWKGLCRYLTRHAVIMCMQGEVEATIDEAVAAQKWSDRKEEPEYVI